MENNGKRVAVVILNWNGEQLLREFLPSVIANTNSELARVVVADNGSTDGSVELLEQEFAQIDIIRLPENYGFAGGYNRVIEMMHEEYVVLLNSDVETAPGWLEPLVDSLDSDALTGVVQPKIKAYKEKHKFEYAGAAGGYMDKLGFPFCRGRILDNVETDQGQYDTPQELFWCSGAAFCVRRELYVKLGGLDERFFAHMEEIDLCWRLRNAGYAAKVVPTGTVYHLGGGSLPMNHPRKLFLNYRNNLLMLYKNMSRKERLPISFMRFGVDMASMLFFAVKGEWGNAGAVLKAYREYANMKQYYTPPVGNTSRVGIYERSILWDAYVLKKNKFSDLPTKPFVDNQV
ncbi:MAG: glycosyltransferase family 2 protein [Marinifilaceae bacterium]